VCAAVVQLMGYLDAFDYAHAKLTCSSLWVMYTCMPSMQLLVTLTSSQTLTEEKHMIWSLLAMAETYYNCLYPTASSARGLEIWFPSVGFFTYFKPEIDEEDLLLGCCHLAFQSAAQPRTCKPPLLLSGTLLETECALLWSYECQTPRRVSWTDPLHEIVAEQWCLSNSRMWTISIKYSGCRTGLKLLLFLRALIFFFMRWQDYRDLYCGWILVLGTSKIDPYPGSSRQPSLVTNLGTKLVKSEFNFPRNIT
jgi:hypothetical protein